jgi:hypothetical protein
MSVAEIESKAKGDIAAQIRFIEVIFGLAA